MKLLQILPTIARGGCEEYALTVARAAIGRGWNVHAALSDGTGTASLVRDYQATGIRTHIVRLGVGDELWAHSRSVVTVRLLRTLKLLAAVRPQLVHFALPWPPVGLGPLLACGLFRVPSLVVFQLVTPMFPVGGRPQRAYAWARSRGQKWVAVSEHNRRLLSSGLAVPPSEIRVIYNGAGSRRGKIADRASQAATRQSVRQELGLPHDAPLVLGVGRLAKQKGFDLLIAATARVVSEVPHAVVVIAGEGTEREALEAQARGLGLGQRLRLLGHRQDVARLMAASDVFAFPTRFEGHPFALVEAMAAGLPVVAADVSGIAEIVKCGHSGILTPAEDATRLAQGLLRLLQDPGMRASLGCAAASAAERFSEAQMLDETFAEFEGLTSADRRAAVAAHASVPGLTSNETVPVTH